ncbi:MAG: hypothetical protein JW915_20180 [Chitinispirillaceae bacterium]|nr:hypothetical protein [Chitinispirillaceae bacterium]
MNFGAKASGGLDLKIEINNSAGVKSNVSENNTKSPGANSVIAHNKSDTSQENSSDSKANANSESAENFYSLDQISGNTIYPLKFNAGAHKIVISKTGNAHIVRLIGLTFDSNKCFLLPYALPGIRAIVEMHKRLPKAEVLIVGHDGGDEEFKGVDLAYNRAEILRAYLTNNVEAWLRWFGKNIPPAIRWGTHEIQLMLSSLPEGEKPFYFGNASGVTDQKTKDTVKAFQAFWNSKKGTNLKVDGIAGPKTQKEIVTAYMEIEDTSLSSNFAPVAHGCEGQFEDDLTLQGMQPDERIIEIFFFEKGISPKPAKKTSFNGSNDYFKWKKQIVETKNFEYHGIHIQIIDKKKKPVKCAKIILEGPKNHEAYTDEQGFAFFSGLTAGEYCARAEKKGIEINSAKITYPTAKTKSRVMKKK